MYPINRNRRLRTSETLRNLIRENTISANDFLVPLFVIEGENKKQEINLCLIILK
jgi:porphobilinogen synthase